MINALEIKNINVFHGQFHALRNLCLKVRAGTVTAIIGANGAGKSTLLKTIAGSLLPQSGSLLYYGHDITKQGATISNRSGISLVPEGRQLFPSLSIEENIQIGAYSNRKGVWDLNAIFEQFPELKKRRNVNSQDVSGGEQQMTAISRALASNPDLILLDELSLGLAPKVVSRIYDALPGIIKNGTTVILVEQSISRALSSSDYLYCLREGRVTLEGTSSDVRQDAITNAYFGV